MTKILTFFLILFTSLSLVRGAEDMLSGGVFVQTAAANSTYNSVGKTATKTENLVVGKTYYVAYDIMEIKTTNDAVRLTFSTGLQAHISFNSTFSVDNFNQMCAVPDQPGILKWDYWMTALSLMDGEVTLVVPKLDTNTSCVVQTPLVNVNLTGGNVNIKSSSKYVMINALDGEVTVIDSKDRKSVIDKGEMGIIIPFPGRDGEIMVAHKSIAADELARMTKLAQEVAQEKKDVLFVVIDKKVVGVRLK